MCWGLVPSFGAEFTLGGSEAGAHRGLGYRPPGIRKGVYFTLYFSAAVGSVVDAVDLLQ